MQIVVWVLAFVCAQMAAGLREENVCALTLRVFRSRTFDRTVKPSPTKPGFLKANGRNIP
jgi:hypothetical protein